MLTIADLDEFADKATGHGWLVLPASVTGDGLTAELDDLNPLLALLAAPRDLANLAYLAHHRWTPELRALTFQGLDEQRISEVITATGFSEDANRVCVATLAIMAGGVLHVATATEPEFAALHERAVAARERLKVWAQREMDEQDETNAMEQRRIDDVMVWIRSDLTASLLADDAWLALSTTRAREAYAKNLVCARLEGRQLEQRVVTAILDVLSVVTEQREQVVRDRTAGFRAEVACHGRVLGARSEFSTATARTRAGVADDYVRAVDPVVPAALVRDQLVTEALTHVRPQRD